MHWFTGKKTGDEREKQHIRGASHLQRLIFHFQPNLKSTGKREGVRTQKEGWKRQTWCDGDKKDYS